MRRFRTHLASLVLIGLILPWANVAATSMHLASDHHDAGGRDHEGTIEEAFHGHHHDDGDAQHDHPRVGRDLSSLRARLHHWVTFPATVPVIWAQSSLSPAREPLEVRRGRSRDHGPPGADAQPGHLRI